jgi:chemotaxis protein CheX
VIDQDLLIRNVTEATAEVFQTMLGMDTSFVSLQDSGKAAETGLISLVGITGEWGGSGVFCCAPQLARVISARMLGSEGDAASPAIDDEVMDVVAEVTNMVIGNIKNGLEPFTGPLAISVPTVIHGRNFQFRNTFGQEYTTLAFETEGHLFHVRISLAPAADSCQSRSRIPVLDLASA